MPRMIFDMYQYKMCDNNNFKLIIKKSINNIRYVIRINSTKWSCTVFCVMKTNVFFSHCVTNDWCEKKGKVCVTPFWGDGKVSFFLILRRIIGCVKKGKVSVTPFLVEWKKCLFCDFASISWVCEKRGRTERPLFWGDEKSVFIFHFVTTERMCKKGTGRRDPFFWVMKKSVFLWFYGDWEGVKKGDRSAWPFFWGDEKNWLLLSLARGTFDRVSEKTFARVREKTEETGRRLP